MSESATRPTLSTPDAPFAAKAAAFAVFAVGLLLFVVYFTVSLPEKISDWRAALPTPAMSETEAASALLRAKYLHEASVRPQLVLAGFAEASDVFPQTRGPLSVSRRITDALWNMRVFPEIYDAFLGMMLDDSVSPDERLSKFCRYGAFLDAVAATVADNDKIEKKRRYRAYETPRSCQASCRDWFRYFTADPKLNISPAPGAFGRKGAEDAAVYAEKSAFAERVLPMVFAGLSQEFDQRAALAQEGAKADNGNVLKSGTSERRYLEQLNTAVVAAVNVMWKERGNPAFFPLAKELLASEAASLKDLYAALPLVAEKPGLSAAEYVFWNKYKKDFAVVASCVGADPGAYFHDIARCGKLAAQTTKALKPLGVFALEGHAGPGVALTSTSALIPNQNFSENLYLLADMGRAMKDAPAYDLSRAYPIFEGTPYRRLKNQPLLLPLNLKNRDDKAVLDWHATEGWKKGRTLLFSATGSPADIARHWASIRLVWLRGENENAADSKLAYLHPESGHFMQAVLPALKGKAAARFLGPVSALWFGVRTVDENGWQDETFEARPEARTLSAFGGKPLRSPILDWARGKNATAPRDEATTPIAFSPETQKLLAEHLRRNRLVDQARRLDAQRNDPEMRPIDVYAFAEKTVTRLDSWGITDYRMQARAADLLWRCRKDATLETAVSDALSNKKLRPRDRLRKARRALDLPKQEER